MGFIIGFASEHVISLNNHALIGDLHRDTKDMCPGLRPIISIPMFVDEGSFTFLLNPTDISDNDFDLRSTRWRGLKYRRLEHRRESRAISAASSAPLGDVFGSHLPV
jgi:hypothetical protein